MADKAKPGFCQSEEDLNALVKLKNFNEPNELFGFFIETLHSDRWVFRGQSNATWPLEPTAERMLKRDRDLDGESGDGYILRAIKSRAHLYLSNLPSDNDTLEWLALAQHYGPPLPSWTSPEVHM